MAFREHEPCLERSWNPHQSPTSEFATGVNSHATRGYLATLRAQCFAAWFWVESRTGAVAWAIRHHPVSRPRSSNRTCGFPASGFPTGFIARHTAERRDEHGVEQARQAHQTPLYD